MFTILRYSVLTYNLNKVYPAYNRFVTKEIETKKKEKGMTGLINFGQMAKGRWNPRSPQHLRHTHTQSQPNLGEVELRELTIAAYFNKSDSLYVNTGDDTSES